MRDPQRTYELFEELFRGSGQAHGLVHGECVRTPPTEELWRAHLFGGPSLGIYPTIRLSQGTWQGHGETHQVLTRWGCSDIDTHGPRAFTPAEARVHAKNLVTALQVLGHAAWIELTKSEGYHVWVFAQDWVPAVWMRSTLLLAHQLADVRADEVNPKDALGATELGNYVNLPYHHDTPHPLRRVILDDEVLNAYGFVESAHGLASPVALVHETAGLYVPPPPPQPVTMRPFTGRSEAPEGGRYVGQSKDIDDQELREAVSLLNGKGFTIWRDGPNVGGRAFTLFRLGVECRESGLSPDDTMVVLVDADWRWGKFMSGVDGHTNGIRYIEDIVRKVYG